MPYSRKDVGNFGNKIRITQSVYGFPDISWNQPMFAIYSFLFITVEAVSFFSTSLAISIFSISQFWMLGFIEVHCIIITTFYTQCCFSDDNDDDDDDDDDDELFLL